MVSPPVFDNCNLSSWAQGSMSRLHDRLRMIRVVEAIVNHGDIKLVVERQAFEIMYLEKCAGSPELPLRQGNSRRGNIDPQ